MKFERDLIIIGLIWIFIVGVLSYTAHKAALSIIDGGGVKVLIEQIWHNKESEEFTK